jgi:UDP-glucuronate 4-epimerase
MRYVVTGAAGFIGSHLAEALLAEGHEVIGIDCFTDYYSTALKEENSGGLDIVRADLAECPLDDLLTGADGIFHLAAQAGVRTSWGEDFALYLRHNLLATQRLFTAAAKRRIRVVFSSSSSIYGDALTYPTREDAPPRPISPYGVTKLACEQLARTYESNHELDVVSLRYFTVYGPRQRPDMGFTRMASALAADDVFPIYGDGLQSRDFTFVGDAVVANIVSMKSAPAGGVYNVGGGSEATLLDSIRIFEDIARKKLDVRFAPPAAGDARRTAADTTRIREELSWLPQVSLEEGLAAQWSWFRERTAHNVPRLNDLVEPKSAYVESAQTCASRAIGVGSRPAPSRG